MTTTPTAPAAGTQAPVSDERLMECWFSAAVWTDELPRYATANQWRADFWAITSGVVAAITGLAIWPVLSDTSSSLEKTLISAAALLAAVCALIPRVKNYAEQAGAARELCARYAGLKGELLDLLALSKAGMPASGDEARRVVQEFESTKEKKDLLRGLPDRATVEKRRAGRSLPPYEAKI